ncbi:MAG: hypothetical protein GX442_08425 [Candidatus Riflebacteria bacterium]|nr:hypothetical protein [Candidatus Riflebacteria bacterium]
MLVTIFAIVVILFLVGGWFAQFMVSLRGQTHRQGEVTLTGSAAQGLAALAAHKLRYDLLSADPGDPTLRTALFRPLADLRDIGETPLSLDGGPAGFQGLADALTRPLVEDGGLVATLRYSVRKADFTALPPPALPEEKVGFVRLHVALKMRALTEEFQFACPVRIAAAWTPVLSKCTFFLDDPEIVTDRDRWKFNRVSTTPDGELIPGNTGAVPIVLANGERLEAGDLVNPANFLQKRVGLVHFGGGPLVLNLARGESRTGTFGEGFHTFEVKTSGGDWDGLYTIGEYSWGGGQVALLEWDKGIADEVAANVSPDWIGFVAGTPEADFLTKNSIFRLFGTDKGHKHPTLVLGRVFRGMISAKAYQCEPRGLLPEAFLLYPRSLGEWEDMLDPDPCVAAAAGLESVATFVREVLQLTPGQDDRDRFRREFASRGRVQGYNASIAYISTNNTVPDPFPNFKGNLLERMRTKDFSTAALDELPAELRDMLPGRPAAMPRLAALLGMLGVPGPRTAWVIDAGVAGGTVDWWEDLARLGLYDPAGRVLRLDGWILLKGSRPGGLVVKEPLTLAGNGGLVLESGDIRVLAPIDGGGAAENDGPPAFTLHLVAPSGSIEVGDLDGQRVDAVLAAGEKVLFRRGRPRLRGGVATGKFDLANASQGADLFYNPNLAALPGGPDGKALLACSVDPSPILLR